MVGEYYILIIVFGIGDVFGFVYKVVVFLIGKQFGYLVFLKGVNIYLIGKLFVVIGGGVKGYMCIFDIMFEFC